MDRIPRAPLGAATIKKNMLWDKGYREIGTIMIDPDTGRRVTIDLSGRVQWWQTDGSGKMSPDISADTNQQDYE